MKKIIRMAFMAAAMFAMVTTVAKAQDAQGGGGGRGARAGGRGGRGGGTAALFKDITLTDAQKASVDSITKVYQDKSTAIRNDANGDMQAAMPKMEENNKARNDAYKSILTDDQQKTFDANVAAMPQRRPPGLI